MSSGLPIPSAGAILARPVFGLGYRAHRKYEVIEVRKKDGEMKLKELPSDANPEPRGPAFWVTIHPQNNDAMTVYIKEETP